MIKRLQTMHPINKVQIISDNDKYKTTAADIDQVNINGMVIWHALEIEKEKVFTEAEKAYTKANKK